jgi:hypothetical protein
MKTMLKQFSFKHKNNKVLYYAIGFVRQLFPYLFFQTGLDKKISTVKDFDIEYIRKRANYYNKLDEIVNLSDGIKNLAHFKLRKQHKTYYFDILTRN